MKRALVHSYKLLCIILGVFVAGSFASLCAAIRQHADGNAPAVLTQKKLEGLLAKARARVDEHATSFKELAAEETKTAETYDKAGKLSGRRRIVSDFVIYQSQRDPDVMAEYRNVREVDGAPVKEREKRVVKLFERLAKADSVGKELDRINREGHRYDLGWMFWGFTLQKGLPLQKKFHPLFRFEAAGREQIEGRDVIAIKFQQTAPSPGPMGGKPDWLSDFRLSDPLYRGRLWVDGRTGQLWREEVEMTMRGPVMPDPLTVARYDFKYVPSDYGVWVPQSLMFNIFSPVKLSAGKACETYLRARTVAEYNSFKRFDVTVQEGAVSP